jgi:hypothetical protein
MATPITSGHADHQASARDAEGGSGLGVEGGEQQGVPQPPSHHDAGAEQEREHHQVDRLRTEEGREGEPMDLLEAVRAPGQQQGG